MTKKNNTHTDTEPKAPKNNYWNRLLNRQSKYFDNKNVDTQQQQHECQIGIYGWRKKFLYILIIIIAALVVLNAALTLWIVSVLNFSMNGLANMKIDSDGLTLNGNAFIDDHLFATTISSRKGQTLRLVSDNNISLTARRSTNGTVLNQIFIGNSRISANVNDFRVNGRDGRLLFGVNEEKVTFATDKIQVENLSGLRFHRSIQTPVIEGYSHLNLISPEGRISIKGPKSIAMESRLGDVSAICLKDLRLKSKQGKITLESKDIEIRNLKKGIPQTTSDGMSGASNLYPVVYQLCVCADNGKIFTAPPDKPCASNETICGPKHIYSPPTQHSQSQQQARTIT